MDYPEGGHSLLEFLDQFPTVTRETAVQALEEAKNRCLTELRRICRMNACQSISGIVSRPRSSQCGMDRSQGQETAELLQAAESGGYQVLLTVDQGIPRQQTRPGRKLSIILIRSRTNQMEDLLPLAAAITQALEFIQPGQSVLIPSSD